MTAYCDTSDLRDYVLGDYLAAAERLNTGAVGRHIAGVSAEIDEALAPVCRVPLAPIPATVRHVAAVIAAWRIVGEVTTLVTEEGATKNEWIPLQGHYKRALTTLAAMRRGESGYGLDDSLLDQGGVIVTAGRPIFGDQFWREKY
jgi:phage gp36-like protein